MDNTNILIIVALVIGIIVLLLLANQYELFSQPNARRLTQCTSPYSYDKNDIIATNQYVEWFKRNFPANKNACGLGYDNPFIYPYNYDINLNWPVNRFKYPGWIRQVDLDANQWMNFPGYVY